MMANAARDPVFWAAVAIAGQDVDEAGAQGSTTDCVRCHAPRAFLEGRGDSRELGELTYEDREGIACDFCHRLIPDIDALPGDPTGNARYVVDDQLVDGKIPKRGPWAYPPGGPSPEHETIEDLSLLGTSAACGTCHDVTTARERVDAEGIGMGTPFNEQRTYSEWLNSSFAGSGGQSCQDCHMPAIEDAVGCKEFATLGESHAQGGRLHQLVGANVGAMRALRSLYGSEGTLEIDDFFYDESILAATALLESAAELEVDFPAGYEVGAATLGLPVRVINRSGHKLPTGYSEGRVMWIEFTVRYGDELLESLGLWDPASGVIGFDEDGVRRYEALAEDADDGTTLHLLRNNRWIVDNRIPPQGLSVNPQTDPVGGRYTAQDGIWPHEDSFELDYQPAEPTQLLPDAPLEVEMTVRLLYLVNTSEYLEFLAEENHSNQAGAEALAVLSGPGINEAQVLAELTQTIPLLGVDPPTTESEETNSEASESGESPPAVSDAGSPPTQGCSCSAARGTSDPGWMLLLVLIPALRRPRRDSP
jgi:MYXO-CTERM domain-containing protein